MKTGRTVVTIGNFDGVHVGHAALVRAARQIADAAPEPTRVVAMCFDPHPLTVLKPDAAPLRLTTFARRAELLGSAGADEVVRLEPTGQLLAMFPEEFLDHIAQELNPIAIIEGPDFRFGRGRAGDVSILTSLGKERGIEVRVLKPVEVAMTDNTIAQASSSLARWLIARGRTRDAAAVLGRDFDLDGTVERGAQQGRRLGFPTANVKTECLLPGDGVYAGVSILPDGRELASALSVGTKPTFGGTARLLESHFLGRPDLSGMAEYGWDIRLRFTHWLRDQVKFGSLEDLKRQLVDDCSRAAELTPGSRQGAVHA